MKLINNILFFRFLFSALVLIFLAQSLDISNKFSDCNGIGLCENSESENSEEESEDLEKLDILFQELTSPYYHYVFINKNNRFVNRFYLSNFILELIHPPEC